MKHTDQKYAQPNLLGRIVENEADHGQWLTGDVLTPYGIVLVYSERGYSKLEFVWEGMLYQRFFQQGFTARGLATKAGQFAKEITL